MEWYYLLGVVLAIIVVVIGGFAMMVSKFYVKVDQGQALIINDTTSTPKVKFTGGIVLPIIHRKEIMKISTITMEVARKGTEGLICKDNIRADIIVAFYIRVNELATDVLKVAKAVGVARASDKEAVEQLFNAKFSEALKTVGKSMDFVSLFEDREKFRQAIVEVIGEDLNGYHLEDVAIDYLEQTPLKDLKSDNILDAEGIKKITQLTSEHNIVTNQIQRDTALEIQKKDATAKEASLALELQVKSAEEIQKRETVRITAEEAATAARAKEESRKTIETAKLLTDQEIAVQRENAQRETEVAEQNRLRAVVIEVEKVTEAKETQIVERQRNVSLKSIGAEREVEVEKTNIANVVRERIAVEKTVAVEEENIKDVRVISEAERQRKSEVIGAEAKAQVALVDEVKRAEAQETAAKHHAATKTITARADQDASDMQAAARKTLADAARVEISSEGLAQASVLEAMAVAQEKQAVAKGKDVSEVLIAQAAGNEALAKARMVEVEAEAAQILKTGTAQADVISATAAADKLRGEAEASIIANVGGAEASVIAGKGSAEAETTFKKLEAEAKGLAERFTAIGELSADARAHEEFRMQLETALEQALEEIKAGQVVSEANAQVLAAAMGNAKIEFIGGGDAGFESFAKSIAIGRTVDGLARKSDVVAGLMDRFIKPKAHTADAASDFVGGQVSAADAVAQLMPPAPPADSPAAATA